MDQTLLPPPKSPNYIDTLLRQTELSESETRLVFNSRNPNSVQEKDNKVALGTLSFKVNKERLPEIVRYFNGVDGENPKDLVAETPNDVEHKLLYIDTTAPKEYQWKIGACIGEAPNGSHRHYGPAEVSPYNLAGLWYRFTFPKTIVDVDAAQAQLTVNAYQNYTKGVAGDLPITLGKYSPMVTATYADGSRENFTFPWGKAGSEYGFVNLPLTAPATSTYAATGGHYQVTQKFSFVGADQAVHVFPVPVEADLTVTPITLLKMDADNLTQSYLLNDVQQQVKTGGDLKLPEQARLITDVVPGPVTLTIPVPGWMPTEPLSRWPIPNGANAATLMNSLKADGAVAPPSPSTDPATPYWPADNDGTPAQVITTPKKFVGNYTFQLATSYDAPAAKQGFTKTELTARYPWMTVPQENYPLPTALRRIVAVPAPGDPTAPPAFSDANAYTVSWVSTVGDTREDPTMTLKVVKDGQDMPLDTRFRVRLPNGLELGTGLAAQDNGVNFTVADWFKDSIAVPGSYAVARAQDATTNHYYTLAVNPGDTTPTALTTDHEGERETLRRFENLGGWFSVSLCEDPAKQLWTEEIPVYVPPRSNLYREDKTYYFLGQNAGLYNWPGGVGKAFTLPRGEYAVVSPTGAPLYLKNTDGTETTEEMTGGTANLRKMQPYGYTTTYDGETGGQPGALYTAKVTGNTGATEPTWDPKVAGITVGGKQIVQYGKDHFLHNARFSAYGAVQQPVTPSPQKTVLLATENTAPAAQVEKITLTCESTTGIDRVPDNTNPGNNVSLVTYDTQTEGYRYYQTYNLKITNVGTTDIYGLDVDGLTDGYVPEPTGGRFMMTQPPASFLSPGASTTFTLTYVPNLKASGANSVIYRDKLYITSSSRPNATIGNPSTYLLDFDAKFEVASDEVYKVRVVTDPADGKLGTAGLVIGEIQKGGKLAMDYTRTTTSFIKDGTVYVLVEPKDEYTIKSAVAKGDTTGNIAMTQYNPTGTEAGKAPLEKGKLIYTFKMPADDVTVTITFTEDLLSKLRLSDLIDFSAGDLKDAGGAVTATADSQLKRAVTTVADANTYRVWQKAYTEQELAAANLYATTSGGVIDPEKRDFHLMTTGAATGNAPLFLSTESQYLVVIPYEASRSQVELKLRQVVYHDLVSGDGNTNDNPDIKPQISMDLYPKNPVTDPSVTLTPLPIYSAATGTATSAVVTGDTATPTVHTSAPFDSPVPATSEFVRVNVSLTVSSVTTTRCYYLEIHRAPKEVIATLNYGNSPYGMIMNESRFVVANNEGQTAATRQAAKENFASCNYSFRGMKSVYIPDVVKNETNTSVQAVTYWREAWVDTGKFYEPESGLNTGAPTNPAYTDAGNWDLDDFSFFATLGQPMKDPGLKEGTVLDSSGRVVPLDKISATVEVKLMELATTVGGKPVTQQWRFTGYDPATALPNPAAQTAVLRLSDKTAGTLAEVTGIAGKTYTWDQWSSNYVPDYEPDGVTQKKDAEGNLLFKSAAIAGIRPGKYELIYTFRDYDSTTNLVVKRHFAIVAPAGDINANNTVTNHGAKTDEALLKGRVGEPLGYEALGYLDGNLYKFRTCDVNNDRNINNIDANNLKKTANTAELNKFYLPTNYVH
ncbi:MAG: hypothetical protein RSC08_00425 [Oscillospiraceae bacterium]